MREALSRGAGIFTFDGQRLAGAAGTVLEELELIFLQQGTGEVGRGGSPPAPQRARRFRATRHPACLEDGANMPVETQSSSFGDFIDLLRNLIREPAVVGTEDSFFRVLMRELAELDLEIDYYQGLLVARGKDPNSLILSAHIDRHGLICTGPNEFQYSAFLASNRSEQTGDSVSEQMMEAIQGRFNGQRVQAHIPYAGTYLGQGTITNSYICPYRNNLIFELDGLGFLQPGTPVSFLDRLCVRDGCVSAQLDNVLSVALLVFLFRRGFQGTALFTAQEEAGRSWRFAHSWFLRQQIRTRRLLVLDTSPYPTREAADVQHLVLRNKDATAAFDPGMTTEIAHRCDSLGITYRFKDEYVEEQNLTRQKKLSLGRTELGRLVAASEGGISGTTIQIPTTGYHTASETASIGSIRAALALLLSYIGPPATRSEGPRSVRRDGHF